MHKNYEPLTGWQPSIDAELVIVIRNRNVLHPKETFFWSINALPFPGDPIVVGRFQGRAVAFIAVNEVEPGAFETNLRDLLAEEQPGLNDLLSHGLQILNSRNEHKFCGRCGHQTAPRAGEWALVCRQCDTPHYPRISPCIIVLVHRQDELLLVQHHRHSGKKPMHTVIAGFIEPGENAEDAVKREILEEVGLEVRNIRYWQSQSWPFPHSLMLGFHAEYASGDLVIEERELASGAWFPIHELPEIPPTFTISRQLIDHHIEAIENSSIMKTCDLGC